MKRLLYVLLAVLFMVSVVYAADVTVSWDQNNPVPAGYRLYHGPNAFPTSFGVPVATEFEADGVTPKTQATVIGLDIGTTYYFAATAVDADGNESEYSDIISYTVQAERVIIRIIDRPKNMQVIWD